MIGRGPFQIPASWVFGSILVVWVLSLIVSALRDMARELFLFFQ
jgi:hypothetical protein